MSSAGPHWPPESSEDDPGRDELAQSVPPAPPPPEAERKEEFEGFVSTKPLLTVGDSGAIVLELAHMLELRGYENAVAKGEAAPVLDDALMRIVDQFQRDNDVDPRAAGDGNPPLVPRHGHSGIVDAETWAKLLGGPPQVTRGDLVRRAFELEAGIVW